MFTSCAFHTGVGGIYIADQGLAEFVIIGGFSNTKNQITVASIPQAGAKLWMRFFNDVPDFQSGPNGLDIRQIKSIAVSQSRTPQSSAIIVDCD